MGQANHGVQTLQVTNDETELWCGVAQEGKYLEHNKSYQFSGFLKSIQGDGKVEIRIYHEKDWSAPIMHQSFTLGFDFQKYQFDFTCQDETGRYTFALFIAPKSTVEMDAFSLLPKDNFYHWKPSVVEAVKRLHPGLIRFPGGCFASFYNWKEGIGEYDERTPEPSYFWGGLNNNDLGTNEFAMLCKEVGAEMMLCVNIYTPEKRYYLNKERNPWQTVDCDLPQIADPEEGIQNAVDWVAYCNLKAGEHPMADLRVSQGFEKPLVYNTGKWITRPSAGSRQKNMQRWW